MPRRKIPPITKILENSFAKTLFKQKRGIYFPSLKNEKISNIEISRIDPDWAKKTCLVRYKIFFNKKNLRIIRGSAKIGKGKKEAWEIMNYLYYRGFDKGNSRIAKPIDFIKRFNLLLYEEAPGSPFSQILEKSDIPKITQQFKNIAKWLAKLHSLPLPKKTILRETIFLDTKDYLQIFNKIKKFMPELKNYLIPIGKIKLINKIWMEPKSLIHNDFYPGNIIVKSKCIYSIDFDRSRIGPPLMDVAALYGCLEFPKEVWKLNFSKREIKYLQKTFLETYCNLLSLNYEGTKIKLKDFLTKVYLNQITYYAALAFEGWPFLTKAAKKGFISKIKSLLIKIKKT